MIILVLKKVTMTNKVIRKASKCANFIDEKSRFLKQVNLKLFIY